MPEWIIIADDLSAAWDAGAAFAAHGWTTRAALLPGVDFAGARAYALTTESRGLTEGAAVQAVEQALASLQLEKEGAAGQVQSHWFKTIDLALRGHPRAELDALLRGLRLDRALVAPAFPSHGRVVPDARLWAGDAPDEETAYAAAVSASASASRQLPGQDLLSLFDLGPGSRGLALDDLRQGAEVVADQLARGGPGIVLADAETDSDLRLLAQAGLAAGFRLFCGSPALAQALVAVLPDGQPEPQAGLPADIHQDGPVLIVAGSRSPVTQRQVETVRQQGLLTVEPGPEDLREDALMLELAGQLTDTLSGGHSALIGAAKLSPRPGNELLVASGLATLTLEAINRAAPSSLVLTGGDTAVAVCRALGCRAIDLGGELQPGIVWGRLAEGRCAGLPVILKAGSIGGEQTLIEILNLL